MEDLAFLYVLLYETICIITILLRYLIEYTCKVFLVSEKTVLQRLSGFKKEMHENANE